MCASTQGRPSRNRANLGLDDAIPLGLWEVARGLPDCRLAVARVSRYKAALESNYFLVRGASREPRLPADSPDDGDGKHGAAVCRAKLVIPHGGASRLLQGHSGRLRRGVTQGWWRIIIIGNAGVVAAGATIMYWAARIGGPPLLLRWGGSFGITPEKIEAPHRWATHYGAMGVFISRLLPVVRRI